MTRFLQRCSNHIFNGEAMHFKFCVLFCYRGVLVHSDRLPPKGMR